MLQHDEPQKVMLKERSHSQKVIHCMILFVWNSQDRQIHRDRKKLVAVRGWGRETLYKSEIESPLGSPYP